MNPSDFDPYAENYEELIASSTFHLSRNNRYFAEVKMREAKRLAGPEVRTVLDFGCGPGGNLPFLATTFPGAELHAFDVSEKCLERASKAHPSVSFHRSLGPSVAPARFDLVFMANVLHHVPPAERPSVVNEAARMLSPQGVLLVFEHNPANPLTRLVVRRCVLDRDAVLLWPSEAVGLARSAGLAVQRDYIMFLPPALSCLARLERLLARVPFGAQYVVAARQPQGCC